MEIPPRAVNGAGVNTDLSETQRKHALDAALYISLCKTAESTCVVELRLKNGLAQVMAIFSPT